MSTGVLCIVQARMSSSRLPGKVLAPLLGRPLLARQIERLRMSRRLDALCVATSADPSDQAIADCCTTLDVGCYRGNLDDVLDRFYQAALTFEPAHIVRITGDCPLLDPDLVDAVVEQHLREQNDYTSNVKIRSFPDGLDVEIFSFAALERAWKQARSPYEREHVTPFFYRNGSGFRCGVYRDDVDRSAQRWVVDYPEDLEFVRGIYAALYPRKPDFRRADVHQLLEAQPATERYRRSLEWLARAEQVIPLGSQTFSKSPATLPRGASPCFLERGRGSHVWDLDGNEYIDFVNGLMAVSLGYCDRDIDAAVRHQLSRGVTFSLPHPLEAEVAESIIELVPCAEAVRFGKNGSDATAGAVRLARACTGRDHIAVCGYHGWQDWYIGATTRHLGVPQATRDLTHVFRYNDAASLERLLDGHAGEFAAVMMEPMNTEWPQAGFLEAVADLTRRHGALLVFDEIITGFRFAAGGAQQLFGVTPDLATLGKGLGNGYPISVVTGRRDLMRRMEDIFFSFTFGGETLSLAAAKAFLAKLRNEPVLETIHARGEQLMEGLRELLERHNAGRFACVSGHPSWPFFILKDAGPYAAIELRTLYLQEMFARGILVNGGHSISYAHSETDIQSLLSAYDEVLPLVGSALEAQDLPARLHCDPLVPLFRVR